MSKISKVTPTPFDTRPMAAIHKPFAPKVEYATIIDAAAQEAIKRQWPEPVGSILALPGRILISFMGVVVAMLSVTGVIIWWRKRASRVVTAERRAVAC